ncbi:MAG: MFS transporter [Chloroflexi bacterium]|nr:MFS transporter [Chloroflexota bacterium]
MINTFYILILTQITSLIGSRMTGIAIGIWIFTETGSAAPLLIAAFFAELPGTLGAGFMGFIADRYDRRLVIVGGDAGQAMGTVILLTTFALGVFQYWHLYLAMLLHGVFATLQEPASQAAITSLVPENQRDRANGIRQIGFPLAGVIAPAAAGLLYGVAGVTGVIVVDLLTFVFAVGVVLLIVIPPPMQTEEGLESQETFWKEITGGWRFLRRHKALLWLVIYLSFVFFLINGPLELAVPYLTTQTSSEAQLGLLLSVMNLGAFAGAGLIAIRGNVEQRVRVLMISYTMHAVFLMLYGVARSRLLLGLALFFVMVPLPLAGAVFSSLLQSRTPPDMQGRVFAATDQIFVIATPFSFLITAYLVDNWLEPAVDKPGWQAFAPLFGDEQGAGMGLLLFAVGIIILIATALIVRVGGVQTIEEDMPRYSAAVPVNPG